MVHSDLLSTSIFGQNLPIQTGHHTSVESRHPEVTKNPYNVLSTHQNQIPIFLGYSSWTNLGEYHDLYLKSDTLLLAVVFENFREMCLKIYELDPVKLTLPPRLVWQTSLKKTKLKLELLTDNDMLLMVKKCIN